MKIKCNKIVICSNYNCAWNCDGHCGQDVVALDVNGKCALVKPKPVPKDVAVAVAQNKSKPAFDIEASK